MARLVSCSWASHNCNTLQCVLTVSSFRSLKRVSFTFSFLTRLTTWSTVMFRVSQHQTSAHTRMKQHELWLSQVMAVALKGMWPSLWGWWWVVKKMEQFGGRKKLNHSMSHQKHWGWQQCRQLKIKIIFDPRLFSHILKTAPFNPVLLTYLVAMKTKHCLHVSKCAAFSDKNVYSMRVSLTPRGPCRWDTRLRRPEDRSGKVRQGVGLCYLLLQFKNNTVFVVCSLDREKAALTGPG